MHLLVDTVILRNALCNKDDRILLTCIHSVSVILVLLYQIGNCCYQYLLIIYFTHGGPGSSVSIATGYGLDGPVIESRWARDFPYLSRRALGPTQPPVQWVPGLSRGVKSGRGVTLTPFSAVVKKV